METNRVRQSIKVSLETKFVRQKAEFMESFQKQMSTIEQKLAAQVYESSQNLINMNIKIASLEKKNDEKSKIILEQEAQIRCYLAEIPFLSQKNKQREIPQIKCSTEIRETNDKRIEDLNLQINELKFKNLRLQVKLGKLLAYLSLLTKFPSMIAAVTYFISQVFQIANHCFSNQKMQNEIMQENLRLKYEIMLPMGDQYEKLMEDFKSLERENKDLKKRLVRHDMTSTLDLEEQKKTINTLGEQVSDQQKLIEELAWKIRERSKGKPCKTLNDILIKKRILSIDGRQPVFDVNESGRKVIVERYKLSTLSFTPQPRMHTVQNS